MKSILLTLGIAITVWITGCSGKPAGASEGQPGTEGVTATATADAGNSNASAGAGEVIHLTKQEFLEKVYNYEKNPGTWVFESDKPCIVDFYADWCRPCKMVAPIMAEMAEKYKGQIYIYKINTDQERELAQYFGIRSIPSLLFCPSEGQPQMTAGAYPKEQYESMIQSILLKK